MEIRFSPHNQQNLVSNKFVKSPGLTYQNYYYTNGLTHHFKIN